MTGALSYTKKRPRPNPDRLCYTLGVHRKPLLPAICTALLASAGACVPPGNSTPNVSEAGAAAQPAATFRPSIGVMTAPFFDDFDKSHVWTLAPPVPIPGVGATLEPTMMLAGPDAGKDAAVAKPDAAAKPSAEAGATAASSSTSSAAPASNPADLGPDWTQAQTTAWRIENGRLCGQNARNHGVWLNRILPVNARIEFDAISDSPQGDLKAEVWGDGQSSATGVSYTDATSYLAIYGGWKNSFHVLARINEHGTDRKEIKVDPMSDDPRQRPVTRGQTYHFKIERTDGKTVRWAVDNTEMLSFPDGQPLVGFGHDHFGFNDWEVKVCFDNVRVTPL